MKKVLVFGKNGQIASSLASLPEAKSWNFIGASVAKFETPGALSDLLDRLEPNIVINTAAYTAVDRAESEKSLAHLLNAEAPGNIARWCQTHGAILIHFSSDYVYPGTGNRPWEEVDQPEPLNYYGVTKLEGDQRIMDSGCQYLILRTSWVFSAVGTNFVKTMLRLGKDRTEISVVSDQIGAPTAAKDLATAVDAILHHPDFMSQSGVFHVAGQGEASWFNFAQEIFREARKRNLPLSVESVIPITTAQYPTPARRPLNSRLNTQKLKRHFGIELPPWRQSLAQTLGELCGSDLLP